MRPLLMTFFWVPSLQPRPEALAQTRFERAAWTYPKQFECEGAGNVVAVEVTRVGGDVRVATTLLKRHYSGVHLPP